MSVATTPGNNFNFTEKIDKMIIILIFLRETLGCQNGSQSPSSSSDHDIGKKYAFCKI